MVRVNEKTQFYFNDPVSIAEATYFECCEKVVMADQFGRIKRAYGVLYFKVPRRNSPECQTFPRLLDGTF
jgi:hypothetical protein